METLGKRLRYARDRKGITGVTLANMIGVQPGTLSRWMNDEREPNKETILKLAQILGTSVSFLLGETSDPSPVIDAPSGEKVVEKSPHTTKSAEMFAELMEGMAKRSPDLVVHFRDLQKAVDNLTEDDIQGIADAYALATGRIAEEAEKRLQKKSRHGDL